MIDKLGLDGLGGASVRKPKGVSKLDALIEAAKAATPGPWFNGDFSDDYGDNPVTVYSTKPELLAEGQSHIWPDGMSKILVADTNEGIDPIADATYISLANPTTILELCALLEKAEEALREWDLAANNSEETEYDDMASYVIPMPIFCDANEKMEEALAAIKQWKEGKA